jgi:hypothetical protein
MPLTMRAVKGTAADPHSPMSPTAITRPVCPLDVGGAGAGVGFAGGVLFGGDVGVSGTAGRGSDDSVGAVGDRDGELHAEMILSATQKKRIAVE